jgi:excisionase family DNA binding protein
MSRNYTVNEVAEYFRRSQKTIWRWIDDGMFPHAFKVKDGYLIPEEDIVLVQQPSTGRKVISKGF